MGFTLFELLLVLVIIGIGLTFGLASLNLGEPPLTTASRRLEYRFSRARADAILHGTPVILELEPQRLSRQELSGLLVLETFPPEVRVISFGDASLVRVRLVFGPSGISGEYVLVLQGGDERVTMYIPPVGNTRVLPGAYSLPAIRKNLL